MGCHLSSIRGIGLAQALPTGGIWGADPLVPNLTEALRSATAPRERPGGGAGWSVGWSCLKSVSAGSPSESLGLWQ